MSMAATNDECQQYYINHDQKCSLAGCGYYNNKCVACPAGTYQNQPPSLEDLLLGSIRGTECRTCLWPWQIHTNISSKFYSWIGETGKTSLNNCQLNLTIPAGYELAIDDNIWVYNVRQCLTNTYKPNSASFSLTHGSDPNNPYGITVSAENIPTETQCKECGNNATHNADHTNCDCEYGYYYGDNITNTTNADSNDCALIAYSAEYCAEPNSSDCWNSLSKLTLINAHTIPTIDCTDDNIQGIPEATPCFTQKTGYDFTGDWKANRKLLVHSPGGAPKQIESGGTISIDSEVYLTEDSLGDVTFTAVWKAKEFKVTYDTDNKCPTKTQDCTYDTPCYLKYDNTCNTTGQYITGWKCTDGCSDKDKIYESGANISNISGGNDMTLTAEWKKCDAGYYCDGGTQNPCPAGSTSDGGSDEIADCYLSGETNFCHGDACFTIPDLKIPYSSK